MKIQSIDNTVYFQKLVIKNPRQMPREVYLGIIENESIKDLAALMDKKGMDLTAEYIKSAYSSKKILPSKVLLHNAKQYYNRYFKYDEAPYKDKYASAYSINGRLPNTDEFLTDELYYFDPYDIREEVHRDVLDYFAKIFAERDKNQPIEPKPQKKSFWMWLFK